MLSVTHINNFAVLVIIKKGIDTLETVRANKYMEPMYAELVLLKEKQKLKMKPYFNTCNAVSVAFINISHWLYGMFAEKKLIMFMQLVKVHRTSSSSITKMPWSSVQFSERIHYMHTSGKNTHKNCED